MRVVSLPQALVGGVTEGFLLNMTIDCHDAAAGDDDPLVFCGVKIPAPPGPPDRDRVRPGDEEGGGNV
eukprot:1186502-Prorocentrum_minimum.AAC.1